MTPVHKLPATQLETQQLAHELIIISFSSRQASQDPIEFPFLNILSPRLSCQGFSLKAFYIYG